MLVLAVLVAGCSETHETPAQRADAAKALFETATKNFHLPSDEAKGAEQRRLQDKAAAAYGEVLQRYPEQELWASQSLRSLANIRASQTNLDEAIKLYASVDQKYPKQEWEVLMSLKSAGDLLWDAGRKAEARTFYEKIVARFDRPESAQVVKTVVRGSKSRLAEVDVPKSK